MHRRRLARFFMELTPRGYDVLRAIPNKQIGFAAAALLAAALASVLPAPVYAQTQATISGVLADPSGAGVPGASLTLTHQDTGVALITEKSDLGVFDTYTESSARTGADYRQASFEEYVQDSWKASRKLTLELGVRFTTRIPWRQRNDIMAGFSPGAWNPAQASVLYTPGMNGATRVAINPITKAQLPAIYIGALVPGVGRPANGMIVVGTPGVPNGLTTSPAVDLAPRFGFAYDVSGDGKTAIRGGFGISYLPTSSPSLCCSGSYQSNPPLAYTPKTYYGTLDAFVSSAGTLFPSNVLGNSDSRLASSYSFSLGGQRDIGHAVVVDVAVVGNLGRHLEMSQNLNQLPYGQRFLPGSQHATVPGKPLPDAFLVPYAGLGTITFREPIGTSSYYALQAQANRRNSAATFNPAGQQVNTLFGKATADRGPRVIQLALRVTF